MFTKEMIAALEADGEKLRQLTGEDHGPEFLTITCSCCGGDGGFMEGDQTRWMRCTACNGDGELEVEPEPIQIEDLEFGPIYTRMPRP